MVQPSVITFASPELFSQIWVVRMPVIVLPVPQVPILSRQVHLPVYRALQAHPVMSLLHPYHQLALRVQLVFGHQLALRCATHAPRAHSRIKNNQHVSSDPTHALTHLHLSLIYHQHLSRHAHHYCAHPLSHSHLTKSLAWVAQLTLQVFTQIVFLV